MPADQPTILATSGGYRPGRRTAITLGPLVHHALDLSGVHGRTPHVVHLGTAGGDQRWFAAEDAGIRMSHLSLFSMPSVDDVEDLITSADAVWVGGGSVVNLLAVWRAHGLDAVLHRAWRAGVVLAGVSAGSICWHDGGTTDSFGPQLRAVTNGLGFLPYANGVHHDSEPTRAPALERFVRDGTLGRAHCTDDGVGLVYGGPSGVELVETVTEVPGKAAWIVQLELDGSVGTERLEPRLLPAVR